jgi:hypothetical protein
MKGKIMRKTLTILTTSLIALTSAKEAQADAWKSGFYVGAQGGYQHMKSKNQMEYDDGINIENFKKSASSNGGYGGLQFGYRHFFPKKIFTSLNLAGGINSNKTKAIADDSSGTDVLNKLERQYTFSPSIQVGKAFTENMLGFLQFSFPISRMKLTANDGYEQVSKRMTQIGFAPGVGIEKKITQQISTSILAAYEFGVTREQNLFFTDERRNSNKIRVRAASLLVGINYNF